MQLTSALLACPHLHGVHLARARLRRPDGQDAAAGAHVQNHLATRAKASGLWRGRQRMRFALQPRALPSKQALLLNTAS
jgi:hypothetical protein